MYNKQETEDKKCYYIDNRKDSTLYALSRQSRFVSVKDRQELGNKFVKRLAIEGKFKGVLTFKEIRNAARFGYLPKKYNVHHYVPLAFGGKHEESNLCVIDKRLHRWLHAYLLDPIYRDVKLDSSNKNVYMFFPTRKEVFSLAHVSLFFSMDEYKKILEDEKTGCVPIYHAPYIPEDDYASSLRYMEQIKKEIDLLSEEDRKRHEQIANEINSRVRNKNTSWRRKGRQISAYWNERREGKTRIPLTRSEKGALSAKKERRVKKASPKRWYPHLVARRFSRGGRE